MTQARDIADLAGAAEAGTITGRNLIINGAMQVAQRSTSVADVGGSSGYFTCDRWRVDTGNTAGRLTMSQASITDLPGFTNALKLDVTTDDTSLASGEVFRVGQRIEGHNLQQIAKGTASAKALTLSFYVKGNAAATYVAQLKDTDNTRANTQNFSVTTSWTRVELTYVADTTGTLDNDNANSLEVMFWLHGGNDFTSGTFASNTWASETNANNYAGSNTSIFDSTDRELFITGVQLEVGETATDFEHRNFGDELARCQRYYEEWGGEDAYQPFGFLEGATGDLAYAALQFSQKRDGPTVTVSNAGHFHTARGGVIFTSMAFSQPSKTHVFISITKIGGFVAGAISTWRAANSTSARIYFNAEL